MGIASAINNFLPGRCVLCHFRSESNICPACDSDLPLIQHPCFQCGLPLGILADHQHQGSGPRQICGNCITKPPLWSRAIAPLAYTFPVTVLVQRFKFRKSLACGVVLAERLSLAVRQHELPEESLPDLLVPVPLHPLRQLTRVYNQAEVIASDVSKAINLPLDAGILRRNRRTRYQPGLTASQRRKNLRGAISAKTTTVKHVAIVDDVMTTGATVAECAMALRQAGVQRVSVWAAARAIPPD